MNADLALGLDRFGISSAFEDMERSDFSAEKCMAKARRSLDFLGHTGLKWTGAPMFEDFCSRMVLANGRIRFLLSPDVSLAKLALLELFEQRYGTAFQYRLYSTPPIFRLAIVDDEFVVVQGYGSLDTFPTGQNMDAPGLTAVDTGSETSLYRSCVAHFNQLWEEADNAA
jgi:hypothetical protein